MGLIIGGVRCEVRTTVKKRRLNHGRQGGRPKCAHLEQRRMLGVEQMRHARALARGKALHLGRVLGLLGAEAVLQV